MGRHYIIMADIIESRDGNGLSLMKLFRENVNSINREFETKIISPLTITLGDEFQGVVEDLSSAMLIILAFEEMRIKEKLNYQLRYIVNYGDIESVVNEESAHGMLGDGFIVAREMLQSLKNERFSRVLIKTDNVKKDALLNRFFILVKTIIDSWKPDDFDILSIFLEYRDYKQVAEASKKTRSQVWKREKTLRINDYFTIKELIFEVA